MFKISQAQNFTYPVTVEMILESGRVHKQNFSAVFRRLNTTEVTEWQTRISESSREGPEAFSQCTRDLAHDVVEGWSDVREENGDEIIFSKAALSQMLDIHPVPYSISQAWLEAINGGAKRKN